MNKQNRVLTEWYQLFKLNNHTGSIEANKHWEKLIKIGLPKFKNSNWKYSLFKKFLSYNFVYNLNVNLDDSLYNKLSLSLDCNKLVFINGRFSSKYSDLCIDPWILNIDDSINRYSNFRSIQPTIFSYLTECLSKSKVHIKLPQKSIINKPLYLLYINEGSNIDNQLVTSHYYHHVELEQDTKACIIEHFVNTNDNTSHFSGARMLISIGERSHLDHVKLIFENNWSYHIAHNDIEIQEFAKIYSKTFVISGPKFTSNQTNAQINNKQSLLSLNSLTFLSDKNAGDIITYIEHNNVGYSTSQQLHKIIAKDHSIGSFNGLIKVHHNSEQTNGNMINNNLLLDQFSSIYSIPKLEIYSDAVQCTHGTTIGEIDSDLLFYLNTRGISKQDAIKMLISAFSAEIVNTITCMKLKNFILKKLITV